MGAGMDWRRWAQIVIVVAALALAILCPMKDDGRGPSARNQPCPKATSATSESAALVPEPVATEGEGGGKGDASEEEPDPNAALVLEDPAGVVLAFGRSRGPLNQKFFLALPERSQTPLPPVDTTLTVRKRPLEREEMPNTIDDSEYVASATVTGKREVTLELCVDPIVDPGTYAGFVTLEHSDMRPVVVPVQVTLQYSNWIFLMFVVAAVVLLTAPVYVWSRARPDAGTPVELGKRVGEVWRWIGRNFVAFAVAVIAGTSAFLADYWYDPAWGANAPKDWFALIGAVFTAFTTGMLTGTRNGPSDQGGQGATPRPEDKPAG